MPRPANQDEPEPDRVKEYRKELQRHRRNMRLKPILNKMHDISQGKSGMVFTCGIGVIRKRLDEGKYMNCPLLEIDLCCTTDKHPFEFSPGYDSDCHDDVTCNTKIRLCSSLSRLEESEYLADHTLQAKAQKILDHWVKRQIRGGKGSINPFDSKTYKSLLNKLGRKLDGDFHKRRLWAEMTKDEKEYFVYDEHTRNVLEIIDCWVIFHRNKPDASRVVARDAQRFLEQLQNKNSTINIPHFWAHIATKMPHQQTHTTEVPLDKEFLLPLKQSISQLDILKSLENNDCVVVQGPPGTGKSHTIGEQYSSFPLWATRSPCRICSFSSLVASEVYLGLLNYHSKRPCSIADIKYSLI